MLLLEYRPLENFFSVGNDSPNNLPWFLSHPLFDMLLNTYPLYSYRSDPSKELISKKKNDLKVYLLFGPCFNTKFELFLNKEEN